MGGGLVTPPRQPYEHTSAAVQRSYAVTSAELQERHPTHDFCGQAHFKMPAYHSVFLDEPNQQLIGNFALLPLRTRTRGPAVQLPALPADVTELTIDASHESYDPLDEILALFRANTFFRNFEIKGPADRVLIYGILFVSEVLGKIKPSMGRREAEKAVMNIALDTNFAIPGDAGFPLNQAFEAPADRNAAEVMRQYIMQMRQELATRLLNRLSMDEIPSLMSSSSSVPAVPSLTPQLPALFGIDLPPCGPIPQVAYENVVLRLRKMWLQHANTRPVNTPVLGICQWILEDYKAEEDESPAGSLRRTQRRTPWRREEVFKYELCWAKYFVREAEALERRGGMMEMEREKLEFVEKLYPVPKELHIYVRKAPNQKVVWEMWKGWQKKKRGSVATRDAQEGVERVRQDNEEVLGNGEVSGEVPGGLAPAAE
ncbi:actin-related protein 2 3 complex subunit 4 [Stemphylium lycopersici]|nr:actin-related protein 2 3 complex subunit 4 [Stemphylium lycopersici]